MSLTNIQHIAWWRGLALCLGLALVCGCHTVRDTEPPRTATEQLLLSHAVDRAMVGVDLSWLQGKRVFVEDKYFESYDKGNAVSVIREKISRAGGLLTTTNDKAQVIVEIRTGGLSINYSETLFGFPTLTLPIPITGPVTTPELAFYKSQKDVSIARFSLFAYMRETGAYTNSTGPDWGNGHFYVYKILGLSWTRTDVPELKKQP